jgi:hypothetical protein
MVMKHAFCTIGTSLLQGMINTFTWSFEYRLPVLIQIIKLDHSLSEIHASSQTSEMNYLALVNTTLAFYITNENGNMEMYDTYLPCGDNEDGSAFHHIHTITIKLDHQKKMCTCACIQQVESDKHVVVVEDAEEISTIAFACDTFKCYMAVHYFANGITETEVMRLRES